MERESIERKQTAQINELNSAREKLTWDNFASVLVDNEASLRRIYHLFISACQSVRTSAVVDVNEVALVVYNAMVNKEQRRSAEKMISPKLRDLWYKLNDYCIDLKKYFRVVQSSRRDVITLLDNVYGHDLPITLDFAPSSSLESETDSIQPIQGTETCESSEVVHNEDNTIYDRDWL